ncbi:MAG TPA: hypothetical protein VN203_01840, partial [Candidatus Acidoferrum sp.]|nr:hypothetical protein [Candidatus Acidoferrum sp.]
MPIHGTALPVLTKVAQVRQLLPEQARLGYPVRLRAVVTYYHSDERDLFIQDETAGIWVDPSAVQLPLHPGQLVEVEGVSGPGDFASEVTKARFRVVGQAPMPAPQRVSGEELASGRQDSQWVEVEGVVRSASERQGRLALQVASGAVQFPAFVLNHSGIPPGIVDAKVRILGVSGGVYNPKNQLIGMEVVVPALDEVVVEQAGPRDLFSLPVRPIHILLRTSAQGAFSHRIRVQGVVTLHRAGRLLFIRDDHDGLLVQTNQLSPVTVGDRVDVIGFPALGEYTPIMEDAIFRRIGSGAAPDPVRLTAEQALKGAYDAELVRI